VASRSMWLERVRWPARLPHYSLAGLTGALLFGSASFTPSLLPRSWFWQGVVDGLSAAFGYAVGVALLWVARLLVPWRPTSQTMRQLWFAFFGAALPLVGLTLWLGQRWQHQVHVLTDTPPPSTNTWIPILLLSLAVLLLLIATARALRRLVRGVARRLSPWLPGWVAAPLAFVLVAALLAAAAEGVALRLLAQASDAAFAAVNRTTGDDINQPAEPERSGSPASLVPWDSLGRKGREFVALGPDAEELATFSGRSAKTPVRVYVGVESAPTDEQRAALAVRELRRTGGLEREVLVVAIATGTGVVDPEGVDALEYMYDGDTATVSVQYSYLPSFIALLVDQGRADRAGRELFEQVHAAWAARPEPRRPRLLLTGTSLGVLGAEAAFDGLEDIRRRSDGVVWSGPPSFSPMHRGIVERRDPGSPEWLPVFERGARVRFAAEPGDLEEPAAPWHRPRVVYLQNGSDPVVRWSTDLLLRRPDWLAEPRPPDVSPDMYWYPVVTFWQVTADLPSTYEVTPGHGHHYREMYADAWAAVAPPTGWTDTDTERLRQQLSLTWYD
jgi:uncharacterized membrane protein